MSQEIQPFRGRGRGRPLAPTRDVAPAASMDHQESSQSAARSAAPIDPTLSAEIQRLSIISLSTPSSLESSPASSPSCEESTSCPPETRPSVSPVGVRGTRRGFRHEWPLVTRPRQLESKQGTSGVKIQLKSNYFALQQPSSWSLFQYRVTITPEVNSVRQRKGLVKQVFRQVNCPFVYGCTDFLVLKELEDSVHSVPSHRDPEQVFQVAVKNMGRVDHDQCNNIIVYSTLMRKFMFRMGLTKMGPHFYDLNKTIEVPAHKLTLVPGFVTSFQNHENQFLLCVETTFKAIHQSTVLDIINQDKQSGDTEWRQKIGDLVIGSFVLTTYNHATYRICYVEWEKTPANYLFERKKTMISFLHYYKSRYGLTITDKSQPLLRVCLSRMDLRHRGVRVGQEEPEVLLVPEFCRLIGLSGEMKLNVTLMEDLAEHFHPEPQKNIELIKGFVEKMVESEETKKELEEWSLEIKPELVKVPGRVLDNQVIRFSSREELWPGSSEANWTAAVASKEMVSVAELRNWTIVVPERYADAVENLVRVMDEAGRNIGFSIPQPHEIIKLNGISVAAYPNALGKLRREENDVVLVILANARPELYSMIKRKLTVDQGLVSQCFLAKNLKSKGLEAIVANLVVQINAKLGGEPWTVRWPMKNMMVVGMDAQPGTKATGFKNVAAMVATISDTHARYFSTVSTYDWSEELSKAVASDLIKCLDAYSEFNSEGMRLPSRILFFRDGAYETGDPDYVYDYELPQVNTALQSYYEHQGQEQPRLTYTIVNRKNKTRLFATTVEAMNPPLGTVVDDVVTLPERYDFYLVPQTGRHSATSPTGYNVVWDTSGLSPDQTQALTFKACHMYFNCFGTVAVPATCQYARKLAKLVADSVGREPNENLAHNLHFL